MVNSCGYCSQDLARADQRSTVEQKQIEKRSSRGRKGKARGSASKKKKGRRVVAAGGTEQRCSRNDEVGKRLRKRKKGGRKEEEKERERDGEEKKEAEKPIVVRETKEICILSNCRLEVRGRVRSTEGER